MSNVNSDTEQETRDIGECLRGTRKTEGSSRKDGLTSC